MASDIRTEVTTLADQLQRSFHGGAWHGPATAEVIRGVDAASAGRRPEGAPHSIFALVRHMTFWLEAAHQRIARGDDVDDARDWPDEDPPTEERWTRAIADIESAHASLQAALRGLDDDRLDDAVPGTDPTVRGLLLGTLQHNAYHTGQIVQISRELSR